MGDMLTEEEINALLAGDDGSDSSDTGMNLGDDLQQGYEGVLASNPEHDDTLSAEQKDVLGEIGNISMGTAATTLFTLLNGHKVLITTPQVSIMDWAALSRSYDRPCVGIKVSYKEGLVGSNILILKEHDVKVIADLMMGSDGNVPDIDSITDIELSAIGEAMNQMVGSSSTSLSSVINRKIDIDTPEAVILNFGDDDFFEKTGFVESDILACVAFRMEIGDLIDSTITQIIPIDFAKDVVNKMMEDLMPDSQVDELMETTMTGQPAPAVLPPQAAETTAAPLDAASAPPPTEAPAAYYAAPPDPRQPVMYSQHGGTTPVVSAQPAQFQSLDITELTQQKENIGIIMDVPLEVTVELGRTSRKIREILEFVPGTIVDLDKIAGEPIDILVNGKFVATGEVVVVDENFAVRVVDIVNVEKRI